MVVQAILVESAIVALGSVTQAIGDAVGALDAAQKDSFAVGLTFREAKSQFSQDFKGLRGTIETKFAGSMELLHAGLQGNTGGIAKLVNQQKLTEQSTEGTGKLMMALESQLGISRDGTSKLSTNLIFTANKYGVTTSRLVDALQSLESNFVTLNLVGANASVMEGIQDIVARSPGNKKQVTDFANLLFDTSDEAYGKIAALGLTAERDALLRSSTQAEASSKFASLMEKAGNRFTSVSNNSSDAMLGMMVATSTYGSEAAGAAVAIKNLGKRIENQNQVDSGGLFSNWFAEIMNFPQKLLMGDFGGARAEGGPVTGGTPYLVGEKGPELVIPQSSGTVIPMQRPLAVDHSETSASRPILGGATVSKPMYVKSVDPPPSVLDQSRGESVYTAVTNPPDDNRILRALEEGNALKAAALRLAAEEASNAGSLNQVSANE